MENNRDMKQNKYIAPRIEVITVDARLMKAFNNPSDQQAHPAPQRRVTDVF